MLSLSGKKKPLQGDGAVFFVEMKNGDNI